MVDVEHGALRAFEHHAAAFGQDAVEQTAGVGNQRANALRRRSVIVVHLRGIERVGAEEGVGDGVFFFAGGFNVRLEQRSIEQVDDAQAAACHLVFIGRADALAGGADLLASRRGFRGQLDHAVVRQNHLRALGDEQTPVDIEAGFAHAVDLVEKINGVQHHAVADDALAVRGESRRRE